MEGRKMHNERLLLLQSKSNNKHNWYGQGSCSHDEIPKLQFFQAVNDKQRAEKLSENDPSCSR